MVGASAVLALLSIPNILAIFGIAWAATTSPDTLELELVMALIMVLERLLREEGYLDRMLQSLSGLFKDRRAVMAIIPAFIGLMPSAGGAMFSAPLVEQAVGKSVSPEDKAFINFYYRHIWEYFLPVYPGVLLVSSITGIPLAKVILALAPLGLLMIILGLPLLYRIKVDADGAGQGENGMAANYVSDREERKKLKRDVFYSTLPVVVLVGLVLLSVNLVLATALIVLVLAVKHRYTLSKFLQLVRKAIVWRTLIMIWSIMLFKEVMASTGAFATLPQLLAALPIPDFVVFALVSFLVAYLTGMTGNYVGIAFPIVMAGAGGTLSLPLVVFVFMAGSAGTLLSPMHLCLSLSIEYYKADFNKVLRKLLAPTGGLVLSALMAFLFLG